MWPSAAKRLQIAVPMPPTPPVTRTTFRVPMLFSSEIKKNPRGRLGFEPLSGKAIKEEETVRQAHLRLAVRDVAVMPASAKDATFLAALVKLSNAAVAAASCDLIAATAMSPPAGADLAASST